MRFKYFIPLFFIGLVGCDSTQTEDAESNAEPLVHRFDGENKTEAPKKEVASAKKSVHDPEVVPETSYPSIFEVEIPETKEDPSAADGKKVSNVLKMGKEKIKVYDESMGSVNEDSLKKLRKQVK